MLAATSGAIPLDRSIYKEPPRRGLALVVWPACSSPGYQITPLETYWRKKLSHWPFLVTNRESLPTAIARATQMNQGVLPIYVITD